MLPARDSMSELNGKRVLLGVTGGIAAYKAAELTRLLVKGGAQVQVVVTEAARRFVTPATFQALSGRSVIGDLWDAAAAPNGMPHIELSRGQDCIVVAPASADFIAKLAHGLADDLLSTLCLARECRLLVAPAMNRQMWDNPATERNVACLKNDGITICGPGTGDQACGETGLGRMLEPNEILTRVAASFQSGLLQGLRVLITAGPTFEPIDPVRGLTNRSSGKMGYACATAALEAGARVTLISGPVALSAPDGVTLVPVTTAADMLAAVNKHISDCDIFISVAAVADYRPAQQAAQKLKKSAAPLSLELLPTPDILAEVCGRKNPPFCVGFAAESENLDAFAEQKRQRKKLPLLAANLALTALGSDDNQLTLFDDAGRHPLPRGSKLAQARLLIAHLAGLFVAQRLK
jgi:phosphopantothenoylcysteine decarboxylase/phosphopantothenate--cysteine ligase